MTSASVAIIMVMPYVDGAATKETQLLLRVYKFSMYVNGNHWITISTLDSANS